MEAEMLNPVSFSGVYKINNTSCYDLRRVALDMNNIAQDEEQFDFGYQKLNDEMSLYPKVYTCFDIKQDKNYLITGNEAQLVDKFYSDFYYMTAVHKEELESELAVRIAYFEARDILDKNISYVVDDAKEKGEVEILNLKSEANRHPKFNVIV